MIEAVEYEAFSAYLAGLPQSAGLSHSLRSRFQREWPLIGQAAGLAQPMKVASVTPASPGAVIDYVLVVSQASWTFNSGTTYYVNGSVWINGVMTLNGGAIIKYARNATLMASGTLTCNASSSNRAILTAVDDNSVGESIGSGFPSGYYANDALNLYNVQTYSVLQGLHFRYAQDAIFNYSPYGPHYVNNCEFLACQRGVVGYWTTIYLNNDLMCDVDYATYNNGNAYFYISGLSLLTGTADNDGDLLSNKEEMLRLSNPLVSNSQVSSIGDGAYFKLAAQSTPTKARLTGVEVLDALHIRLTMQNAEQGVPYDIFIKTTVTNFWHLHYSGPADNWATGPTRTYTVTNPGTPMAFFTAGDGRDTDHDGLPDGYEILVTDTIVGNPYSNYNYNWILDGDQDADGDGYTNIQEFRGGMDPNVADTITAQVTNIKFNHNAGSSNDDAVNISKSESETYNLSNGEWVLNALNQPACYIINKTVTIKAKFTISPTIHRADIAAYSGGQGLLGNVNPATVTFVDGVSDYVSFTVSSTTPNFIQKTTDSWQWMFYNINGSGSGIQYMNASGPHVTYTILSQPVYPMVLPWVEPILDYACTWANGASSFEVACQYMLSNGFALHYDWDFDCHYFSSDFVRLVSSLGISATQHRWSIPFTDNEYDTISQYTNAFDPVGSNTNAQYEFDFHQWAETSFSSIIQRDPTAAISRTLSWGGYEDYLYESYDVRFYDWWGWPYDQWNWNTAGQSALIEQYPHSVHTTGDSLLFDWTGPDY